MTPPAVRRIQGVLKAIVLVAWGLFVGMVLEWLWR